MERALVVLVSVLTAIVLVLGIVLVVEQRASSEQLEEIACIERIHATAAVTGIVPDDRVDVDGRLEAVRTLSEQLDNC